MQPLSEAQPRRGADIRRVLYIEDDPENWAVAELRLGRRFQLTWARTDVEACELLRSLGAELSAVLMDIELKGSALSGIDLTRALRGASDPTWPAYARDLPALSVPVFFLTAYSTRYTETELVLAGGSRLLTKPVNFAQLSMALSSAQLRAASSPSLSLAQALAADSLGSSVETIAQENPELGERLVGLRDAVGATPAGGQQVRTLALGLALLDMLPASGSDATLVENVLRRAVAARLVGEALGLRGAPEDFAVVGLALESGLLARAAHDLPGALEVSRSPSSTRIIRERAAGEVEHPRRGAEVARELNVAASWVDAIERHHHADPPEEPLPRVAWLAERLAAVFETGSPPQLVDEALAAGTRVGLDVAPTRALLERLPGEVATLAKTLNRSIPAQRVLSARVAEASLSLTALDDSYRALVSRLELLMSEKNGLVERLDQVRQELSTQASTDALTGVANRRAFTSALERDCALAMRSQTPLSLVLLDVDHFKRVNDTHGHPLGDEVLKYLARVLVHGLRAGDLVARYGGEEFALLLPQTKLPDAVAVAERLRAAIEAGEAHTVLGRHAVTASFGVAQLTVDGREVAAMARAVTQAADQALYEAKRTGRNRVCAGSTPVSGMVV